MRGALIRLAALAVAVLVPLTLVEAALRLLPVSTGLQAQPVNRQSPVFHFAPNRDFRYSADWNFSRVNGGRTNNAGFVNDRDYAVEGPHPLLAVVGDSYVEAAMVPFAETIAGRLAARVGEGGRVYSFAASGAPLSQYMIWARHAVKDWGADAVAVVVGNDFDESLAAYKVGPGFHHYVEDKGELVLRRFDYRPSPWRLMLRHSALVRYLVFNLHLEATVERLRDLVSVPEAQAAPAQFVGNVLASADAKRLDDSRRVVEAVLRDFPTVAGLPPDKIAFFVDGLRYPGGGDDSYFSQMRRFFIAAARMRGFEVVDLDDLFVPYAETHPEVRFEWPTDGHWNGLGHQLAAEAVAGSRLYRTRFPSP